MGRTKTGPFELCYELKEPNERETGDTHKGGSERKRERHIRRKGRPPAGKVGEKKIE